MESSNICINKYRNYIEKIDFEGIVEKALVDDDFDTLKALTKCHRITPEALYKMAEGILEVEDILIFWEVIESIVANTKANAKTLGTILVAMEKYEPKTSDNRGRKYNVLACIAGHPNITPELITKLGEIDVFDIQMRLATNDAVPDNYLYLMIQDESLSKDVRFEAAKKLIEKHKEIIKIE